MKLDGEKGSKSISEQEEGPFKPLLSLILFTFLLCPLVAGAGRWPARAASTCVAQPAEIAAAKKLVPRGIRASSDAVSPSPLVRHHTRTRLSKYQPDRLSWRNS